MHARQMFYQRSPNLGSFLGDKAYEGHIDGKAYGQQVFNISSGVTQQNQGTSPSALPFALVSGCLC